MKFLKIKLSVVTLIAILLFSCTSKNNAEANASDNADNKKDTFSYPYKATYSSDVTVPSHPDYAQEVLTVWKNFESNLIDSIKKYFADTMTYENAEGMRFHGSSNDLLNLARKDIENLDSLRFDISMWQSMHVNNKNEQWKIKDNKIIFFNQYKAKPVNG